MVKFIEVAFDGLKVRVPGEQEEVLKLGVPTEFGKGAVELRENQNDGLHLVCLKGNGHLNYKLQLGHQGGVYRLDHSQGQRIRDID